MRGCEVAMRGCPRTQAIRAAGPSVVVSVSRRVAAGVAGKKVNPLGASAGVPGGISPCASVTEVARVGLVDGLMALLGACVPHVHLCVLIRWAE